MNTDPKMDVLFTCYDSLRSLQVDDRKWVLAQLAGRLAQTQTPDTNIQPKAHEARKSVGKEEPADESTAAQDGFAEAFAKANPQTEDKKVLFTAWFLFGRNGTREFKGYQITKALEQTGHGVNSVSVCLGRLKTQKPAMVVQVAASGNKRQSRKSYKLTDAGIRAAQLLSTPPAD